MSNKYNLYFSIENQRFNCDPDFSMKGDFQKAVKVIMTKCNYGGWGAVYQDNGDLFALLLRGVDKVRDISHVEIDVTKSLMNYFNQGRDVISKKI